MRPESVPTYPSAESLRPEVTTYPSSIAHDPAINERDRSLDFHRYPGGRKYLPTFGELVDRLSIVQLKCIFIPENRDEYVEERKLIEHDIDLILREKSRFDERFILSATALHAIQIIMLINHAIWINEREARSGNGSQDHLLRLTHSLNGQRNAAKNILAVELGERKDFKIDAFSADLLEEFGSWRIYEKANGKPSL